MSQACHQPTDASLPSVDLGEPVFENVAHDPRASFRWHTHGYPAPIAQWGFHPEYELHLIRRSHGHYVVGDHIGRFGPGNLVLVGPNLPHCWYSDMSATDEMIERRDIAIQFRGEWLDTLMQTCPELGHLKTLIADSERGVLFTGSAATRAAEHIEAMEHQDGLARVANLIAVLGGLADNNYRLLTSSNYRLYHAGVRSEQVDAVLRYLHRHFTQTIRMAEIADWQGMTAPTFSRFFKQTTGDNFTAFVRRLRIDYACRLLSEPSHSVADICFLAGYGNISNFNRHFRHLTGMTPRDYRARIEGARTSAIPE